MAQRRPDHKNGSVSNESHTGPFLFSRQGQMFDLARLGCGALRSRAELERRAHRANANTA
jgi:hypothetical protein